MSHQLPSEDLDHVLEHTQPLWDELRGQAVFITGGTGFFGKWLVETFCYANNILQLDAKVTVLTRSPEKFAIACRHLAEDPSVELHQGDVRDFSFPVGTYKFVIHAGTTSSQPVEPREMVDTIIRGTQRTIDFAEKRGTEKLLFVSSGAVYGKQPGEVARIPEDYTGAPDLSTGTAAYGEGKRIGELLCHLASRTSGLSCKIARCFAFVGPHLPIDSHFAVGNFIRDVLQAKTIDIKGDGTSCRSYLYAADLAVWLWTILFTGMSTRVYNVGSNVAVSIRELAEIVAENRPGQKLQVHGIRDATGSNQRYVPDTQRANQELGLRTHIELSDAIVRTIKWHRNISHVAP